MPRIKVKATKIYREKYLKDQNDPNDEKDNNYNKNLQSSENCNADLQYDRTCNASDSRLEANSVLKSSQNNHTSYQSTVNCQTGLKQDDDRLTNFQCSESCATVTSLSPSSLTQNCLKDAKEPLQYSVDLQETQDFKPKNLPNINNEPYGDDSNSREDQNTADSQQDHNHPSSFQLENKNKRIKTEVCDAESDSNEAQDFDKHSQLENDLHIKSELCDENTSVSENAEEPQIRSESFESSTCDRETDHSECSTTVEGTSEKPDAENNADSSSCQDVKRSRRNSKRKRESEDPCPVCGLTIRCTDLEAHLAKELESLSNIARNLRRTRPLCKEREGFKCGLSLAYLQARTNRENRNEARRAKFIKKYSVFCPVCKIKLTGTDEEINGHVLNCFGEDDDSDINITDYDENFEEYEIGDETRVRAISLVPGGHRSLHGYASKSKPANDDFDGDLNVDVDDTMAFGEPQYTELDVIHNRSTSSDEKEREQLRRAVISDPSAEPHVIESTKWSQNSEIVEEINEITRQCTRGTVHIPHEVRDSYEKMKVSIPVKGTVDDGELKKLKISNSSIISSLKEKIKDLEEQKNVKCLICLEPYTRPVVSTACWHVHCEECWLVSMGVKKLCPQCNMIVFPTDLRRIYL